MRPNRQEDNRLVGQAFAITIITIRFFSAFFTDDKYDTKVSPDPCAATPLEVELTLASK